MCKIGAKDLGIFFFTRGRKLKVLNKYLVFFQKKVLKNSKMIGYPYEILMDPTNLCGLQCTLCPTGQKNPSRPKTVLKFEDAKKILDKLGKYATNLYLTNWGEPLLNKDVFKIINYAHDKEKMFVYMSTTLNKIDEKMVEQIAESSLDSLTVSLDGASQETCQKYQVGVEFDKVIDRVKRIAARKKALGKTTPRIEWRFIVFNHNEQEITKAKQTYKQLGFDSLELAGARCDMGKEIFMNLNQQFESVKDKLPKNEKYSLYDYKKQQKKRVLKDTCSFLWTQVTINSDGSVSPCCAVYNKAHDFGNILEEGFDNIWNNKKYVTARKVVAGKGGITPTVCQACYKNQAML